MTAYDKADWHEDGALAAAQPAANGFAHIGLYLGWLIRHDLHDPTWFPPDHVVAVKDWSMTGSDIADDIDGRLVSDAMNAEGRRFSDARYPAYLDAYAATFDDRPGYSVVDDAATYATIAPVLDQLYESWVAEGRPMAAPPELPQIALPPIDVRPLSPDAPIEELVAGLDKIARSLGGSAHLASSIPLPHAAPDLERLIPTDLMTPAMKTWSSSARGYGSSLLNRALKRLEVRPKDVSIVFAAGGSGPESLVIMLYVVPGSTADRLRDEFTAVIPLPSRSPWAPRTVAGREVAWATSRVWGDTVFWSRDGLVVHVSGPPSDVERAVARLP